MKDKHPPPVTDHYDLINKVVDMRMRSYIIYNACEHDQTRKQVKDLKNVVLKISPKGVLLSFDSIVTKLAIIVLFAILLLSCTSC